MVLDTDTYNEIDDQFAVVHALLSPEHLNVEALYAAPFHNNRSDERRRRYGEELRRNSHGYWTSSMSPPMVSRIAVPERFSPITRPQCRAMLPPI